MNVSSKPRSGRENRELRQTGRKGKSRPPSPSGRADLGGPLAKNECEGARVADDLGLGDLSNPRFSHPPPPRTPVSPFRLRKKSECVSRRLRLSSRTKVRGPLAPTKPSKGSCSSHKKDQAWDPARNSIFLLLPKNPSTWTPEVPCLKSPNRGSWSWSPTRK